MTTAKELEAQVDAAEKALRELREKWVAALKAEAPWKPDDIMTDRKQEQCKVLRVLISYGEASPVVVYRKKDGTWGAREYTLHSWDRA